MTHTKNTPNCVCKHCGKTFHEKPARIKAGKGKFCSWPCYVASKRFAPQDAWQHVDKSQGPNECWEWQGTITQWGYGQTKIAGKLYRAHRLIFELVNGPIPEGLFVLHSCDNRRCCNPAHLRAGTHDENMQDRNDRGRTPSGDKSGSRLHPERIPRGERHGNAKITEDTVRAIHRMRADGATLESIATHFGISRSSAGYIVRGEHWAHVKPHPAERQG